MEWASETATPYEGSKGGQRPHKTTSRRKQQRERGAHLVKATRTSEGTPGQAGNQQGNDPQSSEQGLTSEVKRPGAERYGCSKPGLVHKTYKLKAM